MDTTMQVAGRGAEGTARPGRTFSLDESAVGVYVVSNTGEMASREPIEAQRDGVILKPELMAYDRPYPFVLLGVSVLAVRRSDESIDFYHLP